MAKQSPSRPPCEIIAQAKLAGPQTVSMRVFGRTEGWDQPYISLRVGQLLIHVDNAAALADLTYVVRQANLAAGRAFGPAPYRPSTPRRR
jgi:hypothetical protein